jgi:hypothetical protein
MMYIVSVFWEAVAIHDIEYAATQVCLMSFWLTEVLQQHMEWICVSGQQDITKRRGRLYRVPASYSGRFGSPVSNFFAFPRSLQAISAFRIAGVWTFSSSGAFGSRNTTIRELAHWTSD